MGSGSGSPRKPGPSVGDMHIGVKEMFTHAGLGAEALANVAADMPALMKMPATKTNMTTLVTEENKRSRSASLTSPGNIAAWLATPFRQSVVTGVMGQKAFARLGLSEIRNNTTGYASEVRGMAEDIVFGPSGQG